MSDNSPTPEVKPVESTEPPVADRPAAAHVAEPAPEPTPEPAPEPPVEPAPEPPYEPAAEPIIEEPIPNDLAPLLSENRVVYVETPRPPRRKGNRGFGVLIAILSAIAYAILLALVTFIVVDNATGSATFGFLRSPTFFVPVLYFALAFIIVALIANRASWWAYILGSLFIGVFVYFASVATVLLAQGIILRTAVEAQADIRMALSSPWVIVAALLAREVSLWMGAAISSRGRRVTVRNAEARAAFEHESATRKAEQDAA